MRISPRSAVAFLNDDALNSFDSGLNQPLRLPRIKGGMVALDDLGRFKTPVPIYPLEGPGSISEDDLVALDEKVDALYRKGYLSEKQARVLHLLFEGEKLSRIASMSGLSQKKVEMAIMAAVPKLRGYIPREYYH